jgi:hypothetical protein
MALVMKTTDIEFFFFINRKVVIAHTSKPSMLIWQLADNVFGVTHVIHAHPPTHPHTCTKITFRWSVDTDLCVRSRGA